MIEVGIPLILKQVATREAIVLAYKELKKQLKSNSKSLKTKSPEFEKSIETIANDALSWSEKLNIIGTNVKWR